MAVVVVIAGEALVSVPLVGRTGAAAVAVLESGGQLGEPQARSVGQHPPPTLAGHD